MDTNAAPRPSTPAGGIRLFPSTEPPITGDPRGRLPLHEASRLRAAAHHAKRAYPGPLGELVSRELTAHAEFGYRFAADGLLTRLADEVLSVTVPDRAELQRAAVVPTGSVAAATPGTPPRLCS